MFVRNQQHPSRSAFPKQLAGHGLWYNLIKVTDP